MSNNNNNNNNTNEEQRELNEDRTIDHFFNLVQVKLATSHYLEDLLLGGGYHNQDYEAEQELLMDVNNSGLMEGALAGITTFVCLVAGPPVMRKCIPPKSYKLDTPPTKTASKVGKYLLMSARLGIQAVASLVIAAYTSSYFTDEEFMLQQVARAPLLEGRSVISDEFCSDFSKEYYRCQSQDYWKHVKSPYLQSLRVFVENCEKRKSYEKSIREEQGLLPDTPVSIPAPGVPKEYPIDESVKNEYLENSGSDEMDDVWVEAIVTDQEDVDEDK